MSAVLLAPKLNFRPMTEADFAEIIPAEAASHDFPWTAGNFGDCLRAGYYGCVVFGNDGLVGYAMLMPGVDEAHLLNITVLPGFRRCGIGSALLNHLIRRTREMKLGKILLEVRPSNVHGRRLYDRHGFRLIGERRGYYPAATGREDALVMECSL